MSGCGRWPLQLDSGAMKKRGLFGTKVEEASPPPPMFGGTAPSPVIVQDREPAAEPKKSEKPRGASTPGFVSAHHRSFASVARGLPSPRVVPRTFVDLLKTVIWPIEGALDMPMVESAARLAALEALEAGTTTVIDHHSSPRAIEGSLSVIANAYADVGVRVICSYATSDLRGRDSAQAGLVENRRFIVSGGRGMVGLDASFNTSPETVDAAIAVTSDLSVGLHVKVAEGVVDSGGGADLVRRSKDSWVLAHGVHLPDGLEIPGMIVHCPRSNMERGVGYAMPRRFGQRVALGTDGFGGDVLDEFRLAYARMREGSIDASPRLPWSWVEAGWSLVPEARQDRVRWSQREIEPEFLVSTTGIRPVEVKVGGVTVLADGLPTKVDGEEIRAKASEQTRRLISRL